MYVVQIVVFFFAGVVHDVESLLVYRFFQSTQGGLLIRFVDCDSSGCGVSAAKLDAQGYLPDSTYGSRIDGLIEVGRLYGQTEAAVRGALGAPMDSISRDTTNIHTGDTDQYVTLTYDDLEFEFYRVAATGDNFLVEVKLSGESLNEALPFPMGATENKIRGYLGEPSHVWAVGDDMFSLQYETTREGATDMLNLMLRDDRLIEITWTYYVD